LNDGVVARVVAGEHPCLRCGACCAAFRVAFYWAEAAPANPAGVPAELTRPLRHHELAMRGTDEVGAIRCIALAGMVGEHVSCRIYAQRPSPCRDLRASFEDGAHSEQCDRARAKFGLPPLTPGTWRQMQERRKSRPSASREVATCVAPATKPLP
jgi:Fe-S-cluster containining protein